MNYDFSKLDAQFRKTKEWFANEITALRTGRASPQLVENIKADYYGQSTPIKHLALISISDAKTITIQPWDRNTLPVIEKAIADSDIGIRPVVDQSIIRLTLPELTGERRAQLIKILKERLEEAKIAVRKARTETWDTIQKKEQENKIAEDEKFRLKDELQKKTDATIEELEQMSEKKTKEIES